MIDFNYDQVSKFTMNRLFFVNYKQLICFLNYAHQGHEKNETRRQSRFDRETFVSNTQS